MPFPVKIPINQRDNCLVELKYHKNYLGIRARFEILNVPIASHPEKSRGNPAQSSKVAASAHPQPHQKSSQFSKGIGTNPRHNQHIV
ncbi:unnamed protein product [Caenorhabditis angaria]|uniref:Uncharacterized protein n=1 Tax=Caenorhabditis angaria TaxID=860376 RepID=A0A9P1J1N9_9PELO|nr:unnamed protein product [Caenorhabditis angaria]